MREHPKKVGQAQDHGLDTPKSHDEKWRTQSSTLRGRPAFPVSILGLPPRQASQAVVRLHCGQLQAIVQPLVTGESQSPCYLLDKEQRGTKMNIKWPFWRSVMPQKCWCVEWKEIFQSAGHTIQSPSATTLQTNPSLCQHWAKRNRWQLPVCKRQQRFLHTNLFKLPPMHQPHSPTISVFFQLWFLQLQNRSPILSYEQQNPLTHLS